MDHIFYLKVENDICSAKVTAINHPYHQVYHVVFEDGYENIFFTDPETGNWVEEDVGETALAGSFGMKIEMLSGPSAKLHKTLSWCRASIGDKIICFGFTTYMEGAETVYEVYADNHKFLYLLRNKGRKWKVYGPHYLIGIAQYNDQVKIIISILKELGGN